MRIFDADVTGSLHVSGSSNFKGGVTVSGSQTITGSLTVDGNAKLGDQVTDIHTVTGSLRVTGSISGSLTGVLRTDYIDFNTGSTITGAPARMTWNDTDGTIDIGMKGGNVTLQVGQEQLVRVVNKTGIDLLESQYSAVRADGAQGNRLKISLAQADSDANSINTLGLVTEDITLNGEGFVTTSGLVRNINTTGALQGELWNDGDLLYLSPHVLGGITNIKPEGPQHTVTIGYVIRAHANVGSIFVKVDNGYEIDELHNVNINTGSLSYGDLLMRSGSIWTNSKALSGSYQLTGSLDISGSQTINGNQIISGSITITQNISVLGTSSFVYVTSSNLNLTGPFIYTNVFEPIERFGGLVVFDSGSSNATASLLWDSQNNHWIYQNASGSNYSGGMLLSGPRNTGSLGDELGLTSTRIPKSVGGDHLDNSNIYDTGTVVKIISNSEITGSLKVTGGISGSIDYSYIQNTPSLVSGSAQINITGTTGYSAVSSSIATALDGKWRASDGVTSDEIGFNETVIIQGGTNANVSFLPGSNTFVINSTHQSVSAASSSNNSGRTYIQDILLDPFGHITGITTATETVVNTDIYTTGVTFNTGDGVLTFSRNDGNSYTVDLDGRYGTSSTDYYVTGGTFNTSTGNLRLTRNDGGTIDVNLEGRYLTAHPSVSAASSSDNSGRTYIQDILLDSFGHITGITTATETVVDTNHFINSVALIGNTLRFAGTGGAFTGDIDLTPFTADNDTYVTGGTFNTGTGNLRLTRNDGTTIDTSLDGRYLTAHPSVSAASSSNNSGRTYIQDILLDSFGHITGITTATETVTDTNNYTTGVTFNTGDGVLTFTRNDGGTYTVDLDGRYGTSSTDYYTTGATFNTSNGIVTFTRNDGGTYTVDLDGKYLDSSSYTASDILSKLLTVDGASSGLDADLLDGQHGSYYYPASNPSGYISSYLNYFTTGATFNTSNGVITFTRNDGNTYTVDIDGKYAESVHTHDDRYLPYESTSDVAKNAGWYTIAVNPGNRASGKFLLRDTSSGNHQSVVFYATHHFGAYSDITVLINSFYGGSPFRTLRIVDGGTYDGALLQVYIDLDSTQVRAWLLEDIQNQGWIIKDWIADGIDPGDVQNFPAMTETPAQVDLDNAAPGGIITTGNIYGGGDTTQYLYLNTNNYSTTLDGRYYTETEIGNFFGGSTSITGYNKTNWDTVYGWGNHGTQGYATTGYVQTQITNLIDGAPAALDTLNELAAALGDDENFATTMTGLIGAKLPLSGGTMTGNIAFGATSNLGLTWGLNTDAAFIKFVSTGNGAGQSYLEIGTQDDNDEEIKFSQSGTVRFYLATDGYLKTGGGNKYVYESGTWGIDISGNAATVTNGVYTNGSYSNPAWITALAGSKITGNISGNAANITTYTINQNLGTTDSVTFSTVASPVYYTTTSSTRNKIRLWGSDSNYTIGMESGVEYGGLNDYAMTFQMNNEDDRGFWWGDASHSVAQGAMSLTTNGYLTVARGVRVGYGESDTTTPTVPLQVYGSGSLVFDVQGSLGQLFSVTDSLSGSLYSVNDISGLPILEVFSDDRVVLGSFGTNAFVVSGTTTTVSGSLAVSGSATVNGGTVWHSNNDGSGSGLDADTLDGYHASSFLTGHPSVSAASSVNNSGRTYIQDILLDGFGHITGITSATETVTDTNDFISDVNFDGTNLTFTGSGGAFSGPVDISSVNTDTNYYVTSASFNTGNGIITLTRNDGGTVTVDIDGKYAESSHTHSVIDDMTDEHRLFNNMGNNHTTYTDFNSVGNFGARFLQGATNGPGTGSSQFYGFTLGLGNDYTVSQYALQLAIPRYLSSDKYITFRTLEAGSWGSWYKIHAGYADTAGFAGALTNMDISQFTNNSGYITSSGSISGNAATATLASTVTINYNNDSNSTYQMLWGSGNSVYGTAGVYLNPWNDYVYATSFNASDWFRSSGNTGWYNSTHGGGIYQTESTMVKVYDNRGFYIDGGNTNTASDGTLYVTATNNNDWLAIFNAYNSSKTEYGVYVRIAASASYGYALMTDGSTWTYRVDGSGRVYAPIYYDINDTAYYLNPASTSNLATVKLNSTASGTEVFTVDGVNGRLFTITDDLSDSLFSVNTIAGVPVIEAFSDYRVIMGRYNQNDFYIATTGEIGMGNTSVSGYKLAVTGNIRATSFVKTGGSSSQFLMADGSVSTNPGWITSYTDTNYYTTGATFNTGNGIITFTRNDGGTYTVDIDGKYAESSHTHDDRYFTETESDARFQPIENQRLSTSNSPTFSQVYADNWFRNNGSNEGLYNESTTMHWSSQSNGYWDVSSTNSVSSIRFYTGGHVSALRGYVYANTSNEIGFLNSAGNWGLRMDNSYNVQVYGDLTVGSGTSSNIYMTDTDETTRRIHTNSGRIGFLNSSNGWGAYNDNTGNWITPYAMYASDWFRSYGTTGWYSESYGGGIYMEDSTWVRVYNNKRLLVNNIIQSNTALYSPIYYDSVDNNYYLNPNGYSNLGTVRFNSSGAGAEVIAADGVNGRLFTITDDMTDSIFSVNTISGLPVIEAFADYKVVMGRYGQNDFHLDTNGNIAMGATPVSGVKLFVSGKLSIGGSNSSYDLYNNGTSYFNGSVTVDDNLYISGGYALNGAYGSWTGEANKIQWHSNNLYFQNTGGGEWIFRNSAGTNVLTTDANGYLYNRGPMYPGYNDGSLGSQSSYYIYSNTSNSGLRTNGAFLIDGNIYWGNQGVWLSDWLNQNVKTNASPTFSQVFTTQIGINDSGIDCYMEIGDGNPTEDGIGYGGTFHFYGDKSVGASHLYFGGAYVTYNFVVGGRITENSSIRYKKDIQQIENGLEKVLQLSGVTYTKISNEVKEAGVIAEEVAKILPEAVGFDTEGRPDSVSYGRLTALLIEAIKDLKKEIDELKGNK